MPEAVPCTASSNCPFYPLLPDDPNLSLQRGRIHEFFKYTKPHRKLLEQIELVIIDEISMVRADIIDAVDRILRVYSRNLREPFGGKQILLVGDVFQLEPVVKGDEREILNRFYPTPYFFSARVFGQIDLVSIELQKVYRQTDSKFIHVLDHIRNNTVGSAELQLLNTRYGTQIEQSEADMYITLATRRDNVDYINDKKLAELPGDPVTFYGEIMGDFPESSLPTSQELVLKPGAQIIFIKNDFDRRWVNGTIGVISGFDPIEETLYVITDDGKECDVKRESWRNIRYKYNEEKKQIEEMIDLAVRQMDYSYVPYSKFHVGAVLLAKNGTYYTGCNIENAGYTATNCAERTAFFKAVSEGAKDFKAICIVGGKEGVLTEYAAPCGVCRQVMMEFCDPETFQIILAVSKEKYDIFTLKELFPLGFGPANLA